jgi:hypothetical protein
MVLKAMGIFFRRARKGGLLKTICKSRPESLKYKHVAKKGG